MITSFPQRIVTWGSYLVLGASLLAAVLSAINHALAFVDTPVRAFIGSVVIGTIWLTAELLIKKCSLRWRMEGSDVRLRGLGIKPRVAAIGAIIFLWLPPGVNLFKLPEEVSLLPHILYEYTSNYPQKFLRLKQIRQSLSGELESKLNYPRL